MGEPDIIPHDDNGKNETHEEQAMTDRHQETSGKPQPIPPGEREYLHGQLTANGSTSFRLLVKGEIGEAELGKILRMIKLQKLLFVEVDGAFDIGDENTIKD